MTRLFWVIAATVGLLSISACSNDPYPYTDQNKKVLYSSFRGPPKTLDPAVAYNVDEHVITGNVYDTLLEYHYLRRPYHLMPGLAEAVPEPQQLPDGGQAYRFKIRPGILFHADPCFTLSQQDRLTREVVAADFAFELMRLADPVVNSPVRSNFVQIRGFTDFQKRLTDLRKADAGFAALPPHEQYKRAGGIDGVSARGHDLELTLTMPNPQLLYWFAVPFTTAMPWEAVAYYTGTNGRPQLADQAVGTGPYKLAHYDKQHRFVLERNESWYGTLNSALNAPGVIFPSEIDRDDIETGRIDPAYANRRMPFLDRITFSRERENIPRFNKFLQGYYDDGGIIKESFDAIVRNDRLSPEMAAKGMRLDKTVEPSVFYIGFNMNDPVLGAQAGDRGRRLRQAMSLAIDAKEFLRLFLNGRGVPAQSPLPPGIFGYAEDYRNPFRQPDLTRASQLLAEAGYGNGLDPATRAPLKLGFDTGNTSAQSLLMYEFLVSTWRELGLNVQVNATAPNQYQDKIRRGAYQIYFYGWQADFPDPENFFFLLECGNAQSKSNGPNTSNFCNVEFDRLYREMKDLPNNEKRAVLIKQMIALLERERPWIELFYQEDYTLSHAWLVNSKPMGISYPAYKYKDVKPELRERLRADWNVPVTWPVYVLLMALAALMVPAMRTYYRERQ